MFKSGGPFFFFLSSEIVTESLERRQIPSRVASSGVLQSCRPVVQLCDCPSGFVFEAWTQQSFTWTAASGWSSRLETPQLLFHAASQHLIGRDEHDADDESDGESAYQTLAHARLLDLLCRAWAWGEKKDRERERGGLRRKKHLKVHWIRRHFMLERYLIVISEWQSSSRNLTITWTRL